MFRRIQVILIIWLLVLIPFYTSLKYIELSSTDSVNSCLETFLNTENTNIADNVSNKINKDLSSYILFAKSLDTKQLSDEEYMKEALKGIPCGASNLVRFKISDASGRILYTSDKYETSDFLHDKTFKEAQKGRNIINLVSLDPKSQSVCISYFFSITSSSEGENKMYFCEILNPFSQIDGYISKIDQGIFPRFFYIISPKFTRYVSMGGIFVKNSEKSLAVSLGCHLANEFKDKMTDGSKLFFVNGKSFSLNVQQLKLSKDTIAPSLFSVVAAHSDSIATLSDELLGGLPLSLMFIILFTLCVALFMSRIFVKMESELQIAMGITDATPVPVIIFELETGNIKQTNQPASILFRSTTEQLLNTNAWNLFIGDKDKNYISSAVTSEIPVQNYELIMQCADGATFWSMLSASPIFIENKLHAVIGVYDVSHRREIEKKLANNAQRLEQQVAERTKAIEEQAIKLANSNKELEEAKQNADKANQAKSKFLTNMSNELKTPLDAIIGYSEVLIEEAKQRKDEVSADDLRKIMTSAKNLITLINEILDLSKIESGKIMITMDNFDISSLVSNIEEVVRPLFIDNDSIFTIECPEDIGAMRCDKTKLTQSILNLLSNSAKFTTNGEVLLKVKDTFKDNSSFIEFIVRDTGVGLTKEQLTKIINAFHSNATPSDAESAIGFGLAITNQYCKILGGTISVDSEYGAGSEFIISIPRIGHVDEIYVDETAAILEEASPTPDDASSDQTPQPNENAVNEKYTSITFDTE